MNNVTKEAFSLRAFASVLAGLSFVLMAVTGLVLFIAPSCRIARDSSWVVWGHDKDQWIAVHVWLSIAFVTASFIHIYLNWAVLTNYFKTRLHKGLAFRSEWISALAICVVIYAGASYGVAPFSSLMLWKETFKHSETGGQGFRGGRAWPQGAAGQQIQGLHGYSSSIEQPLPVGACDSCDLTAETAECAEESLKSGISACSAGSAVSSPQAGGMGRKTLRQFCSDEGIELSWAVSHLKTQGLTVRDTMTMREIADRAGVHPSSLRTVLQP
ncbi:MAG: DUF4405 domain-containing protein [Planctomycetota bacterium]